MCGILGFVGMMEPDGAALRRGLDLMAHRGPDGEGHFRRKGGLPFVELDHRRLAIIDLSTAAAQPFVVDDRLVLVYNGEVYNYVELRSELEGKGHCFRSASDTEVIVRAYAEWGASCVTRFNGMFAFAIWDERTKELFAARDRFGEKPFHYFLSGDGSVFAFASEIKPLVSLLGGKATLDETMLFRFAAFQELAGAERTMWDPIRRLPNAHTLRVRLNGQGLSLSTTRYWDVDLDATSELSHAEASRRFGEIFRDSVRIRLRSDVPVGTSLSGGIDSSSVVCQIHELGAAGGQLTFSARMEDPALDEGHHIAKVLQHTGIQGHEVWPSAPELERIFPRLCYYLEEPFLSTSQFAQHLVMRLAQEHGVTVLLDGQGADELMAGYPTYFLARYADLAEGGSFRSLFRERGHYRRRHPGAFPLSARGFVARAFPGFYSRFRRTSDSSGRCGPMLSAWSRDWRASFPTEQPREGPRASRDGLTKKLYLDSLCGPLQELLRYGDRNSMAYSRELRQPFLDHRLAELVFALPPDHKLRDGETKVIVRDAMRPLVPDGILSRQDKLGYRAPLEAWLSGSLRGWAADRLEALESSFRGRLVPGRADALRKAGPLATQEARTVFALLTVGESLGQMAEVGKSTPMIAAGLPAGP